jgi:hypothetical protein
VNPYKFSEIRPQLQISGRGQNYLPNPSPGNNTGHQNPVDYPNFKSVVKERPDQGFLPRWDQSGAKIRHC